MYRATTPTHTFSLPFDTSLLDDLLITYSQNGSVVIEKRLKDVVLDGRIITVVLTQEESNLFNGNNLANVQVRVKVGGSVKASRILKIPVKRVLNDEVI